MQERNLDQTYSPGSEPVILKASSGLRRFVEVVGGYASLLIVPLTIITVIDLVARKLTFYADDGTVYSVQIWLKTYISDFFDSTVLQELEWHLHTALFALVLGFGTIYNSHVRVDLVRERLDFRRKAWIEFLGISCFMIPYLLLVIYFASTWVVSSFAVGEISASQVGLSHRWIIKGVLVAGLITATIAGISVWLKLAFVLWGRHTKRFPLMTLEWPEEEGLRIEGRERIKVEDVPDVPVLAGEKRDRREAAE
jgi:TRAP-type mannitol/chloroaromatic compound transport system permease small subunit